MIYRTLIGILVVVVVVGIGVQGFSLYRAKQEALASERDVQASKQEALRLQQQHEQLVAANAAKKDWQGKRIFMEPLLTTDILAFSDPKRGVKCRWTTNPDPEPAFFANNSPSEWRQRGVSFRHNDAKYHSFCFVDEDVDFKVEGGAHVCTAVQDYLIRSNTTGLFIFRGSPPLDFGGTADFYVPQWHDLDDPAMRDRILEEEAERTSSDKKLLDQPYVRLQRRVLHDANGAKDYPAVAYRLVMSSRFGGADRIDHPVLQQKYAARLADKNYKGVDNDTDYHTGLLASYDPSGGDVTLSRYYWQGKRGDLFRSGGGGGLFRFRGHYYSLGKAYWNFNIPANAEDDLLVDWPTLVLSWLRRYADADYTKVSIETESYADMEHKHVIPSTICEFSRRGDPEALWREMFPGRELPVDSAAAERKSEVKPDPPRESVDSVASGRIGIAMPELLERDYSHWTYYRVHTYPYSGRNCAQQGNGLDITMDELFPNLAYGWDVYAEVDGRGLYDGHTFFCYMDRDFVVDYHDGAHVCTAVRDYLNARSDDGLNLDPDLPADFGGTADFFVPRWETVDDPSLARSLFAFAEPEAGTAFRDDLNWQLQRMVIDTDADGVAEPYYRLWSPFLLSRVRGFDNPLLTEAKASGEFAWLIENHSWPGLRTNAYVRTESGWHTDHPVGFNKAYFRFRGRYYHFDDSTYRSFLDFLRTIGKFHAAEAREDKDRWIDNAEKFLFVRNVGTFSAEVKQASFPIYPKSEDVCTLQFKFDLPSVLKTYFPNYPVPQ